MKQAENKQKWYQDDSQVEHGCCWSHAIMRKCEPGKGNYGGDTELLAEVCSQDVVDKILQAVNHETN